MEYDIKSTREDFINIITRSKTNNMDGLTNSDVALLQDRGGMFGGDGMAFWIFALLLLNNGGGFGNRNAVTNADLNASQNDSLSEERSDYGRDQRIA